MDHWSVASLTREQQGSAGRWSQCDILWLVSVKVLSPDSQAIWKYKRAISPSLNPPSLTLSSTRRASFLSSSVPPPCLFQIHLLFPTALPLFIQISSLALSLFLSLFPPPLFPNPLSPSLTICNLILCPPRVLSLSHYALSLSLILSILPLQADSRSAAIRVCLCNHMWLHTASCDKEKENQSNHPLDDTLPFVSH